MYASQAYRIVFGMIQRYAIICERFGGDVVLDSLNKTFRDEDNHLDHMYKSKYVRIFSIILKFLVVL